MSQLALGSLCTGYGGLDMAAEAFLGARTVWCAEFEDAPSRVIAARMPGVPNLHDVKRIPWSIVAPVEVLTAGYPCQPFSLAGARLGEDDPRHLWPSIAEGIGALRPAHVLLENVRGHLSLGFDQVLYDLHMLGYAASWTILSAESIGACHRRERLFIYAQPAENVEPQRGDLVATAGMHGWVDAEEDLFGERLPWEGALPTTGTMHSGEIRTATLPRTALAAVALLPTPNASVANDGEGPETWLARREQVRARRVNGNGMGMPLTIAVQLLSTPDAYQGSRGDSQDPEKRRQGGHAVSLADVVEKGLPLLPTPTAGDAAFGLPRTSGRPVEKATKLATRVVYDLLPTPRSSRGASSTEIAYALGGERSDESRTQGEVLFSRPPEWGKYTEAVERHESMLGRAPAAPTQPNTKGNPELAAMFVEWMMCLPAGHVVDVDMGEGFSPRQAREAALKMLGNGVVPPQALAAYRLLKDLVSRSPEGTSHA